METFTEDFRELCNICIDARKTIKNLTPISISTMTIVCELNVDIDISALSSKFISPKFPHCTVSKPKGKHGKKTNFYNCTSIMYEDHSKKNIKVFKNGKLQMTGITSKYECFKVCVLVKNILINTPTVINSEMTMKDNPVMEICMINTNFSINCEIDIENTLQKVLKKEDFIEYAKYDPDVYPGLKVKFVHSDNVKTSIFIFATGSIVITGSKRLKSHTIEAYSFLIDTFIRNWDTVTKNKQTSKKKEFICNHYGYDKKDLLSYLKC
tara:strand:+ start:1064 stop:1864 length:801 start_codon:yes stop_codon:yes gene_type:complete